MCPVCAKLECGRAGMRRGARTLARRMADADDIERALGPSRVGRYLSPNRVTWVGVWIGGASMTCSLLRLSFEVARDEWKLATAILGATLVWSTVAVAAMRSLRRHELPDDAGLLAACAWRTVSRTAFIAAVLGWLNAVTAFLATDLLRHEDLGGMSCFGALCVGPTLGGAAGALFGLIYLWPVATAERAESVPAHDHAETALLRVGAWLTVAGAIGIVGAAPSSQVFQGIVLVVGLHCVAASWMGDGSRLAALRRACIATVPELELRRSVHGAAAAVRVIDVEPTGGARELVRWEARGDGPFRELKVARVIGTFPSSDRLIRRYRLRRTLVALSALLAAISLVPLIAAMEQPWRSHRSLPAEMAGGREPIAE